jgi:hypothetical protein
MAAWLAIFLTTATISAGRAADRAARSAGVAYLVAAAGGIAVAVPVIVSAPWLAGLPGAQGLVLAGAVGYLRVRHRAAVPLPVLRGNGHLIGLADTRTPLGLRSPPMRRTSCSRSSWCTARILACSARPAAPWPPGPRRPRCTPGTTCKAGRLCMSNQRLPGG